MSKSKVIPVVSAALAACGILTASCAGAPDPQPLKLDSRAAYDDKSASEVDPNVVGPLLNTTWGQSGGYAPNFTYNSKTPLMGAQRAPVGCIPVAFGQVLKHYDFPKRGLGTHAYCNSGGQLSDCPEPVSADFYLTRYNWAAMPNSLTSLDSAEAVEAVSTLLYHIGVAVDVTYGERGSVAKLENPAIIKSFRKHFNMPALQTEYRRNYTDDAWFELIASEIRGRRPVVLVGFNSTVNAGHAYVLDGIDADGKVHVNWGWGGHANGYFDLHTLRTPYGSFTEDLFALVNFTPYVLSENESCNGTSGTRCEEGLVCVSNDSGLPITDYVGSDEVGTCGREVIDTPPKATEPVVVEKPVEVQRGEWVYLGGFSTLESIEVSMSGDGDADLYVRRASQPTGRKGEFDCRPYSSGSRERCELRGPGEYFIAVYGYEPARVSLSIETQRETSVE